MINDKCEVRHCRNEGCMIYYKMKVCDKHWNEHCDGKIDLKKEFKINEN